MRIKDQPSEQGFRSPDELRDVLDRALTALADAADPGGRRRSLEVRQCYRCPDLDFVVQIRPRDDGGLEWMFSDAEDWGAQVELTMDSTTANRYFQGAESAVIAIARGRIKVSTRDYAAALRAFPASSGLIDRYSELVQREYPHLVVEDGSPLSPAPAA